MAEADPAGAGGIPVVILTGLSGAGKSTALHVFEDMRFFCVDGLPASLVPKLVNLYRFQNASLTRGLALGMDMRQENFVEEWNRALGMLRQEGLTPQLIFIEAKPEVLVRRYATTRRPHPLETRNLGLEQAIEEERLLLEPIRSKADLVIDTSKFSIHDLRRTLQEKWATIAGKEQGLRLHIISFGYKYGTPSEADLLFDLRFLPNPYFEEALRPLTGRDREVAEYVLESDFGKVFYPRFIDFIHYILPFYAKEGRYRLTIGAGCTGGRHRSVATAEALCRSVREAGYVVTLEHRHIDLG